MEDLKKILGSKVKALRLSYGDTLPALCNGINVSYTALYRAETGTNRNLIDYIPLYLDYYGISLEDLIKNY